MTRGRCLRAEVARVAWSRAVGSRQSAVSSGFGRSSAALLDLASQGMEHRANLIELGP